MHAADSAALLDKFKNVFEGLRDLLGEYHIVTDAAVPPVVIPPRCAPMALPERIKKKLGEMVENDIITTVSKPTERVSSTLAVVKPKKLRKCLDPRDLNRAIRREHCQMLTVEEVVTRTLQAAKFTVVNAKDGFWRKRLDTELSLNITSEHPVRTLLMEKDAIRYLFRTRSLAKIEVPSQRNVAYGT